MIVFLIGSHLYDSWVQWSAKYEYYAELLPTLIPRLIQRNQGRISFASSSQQTVWMMTEAWAHGEVLKQSSNGLFLVSDRVGQSKFLMAGGVLGGGMLRSKDLRIKPSAGYHRAQVKVYCALSTSLFNKVLVRSVINSLSLPHSPSTAGHNIKLESFSFTSQTHGLGVYSLPWQILCNSGFYRFYGFYSLPPKTLHCSKIPPSSTPCSGCGPSSGPSSPPPVSSPPCWPRPSF